jgi:hypothetical protein
MGGIELAIHTSSLGTYCSQVYARSLSRFRRLKFTIPQPMVASLIVCT